MKKFYYFGLASAITYIVAVILGGLLWREYNPLSMAISELITTTAPNQWIINIYEHIHSSSAV